MRRMHSQLAIAVLSCGTLISGCNEASWYDGDGTLVDNGMLTAVHRFELDLGPIDIRKAGKYVYRIDRLPAEEFVFGIQLVCPDKYSRCISERPLSAEVSFQLTDDKGRILIYYKAPLNKWTWSGGGNHDVFLYQWQGPDTFVVPPRSSEFELVLEVVSPEPLAEDFSPRIRAYAGGWKS